MGFLLKIYKMKDTVAMVAFLLFLAKLLGFIKLRVIADLFGASHYLDLFWAAFVIPDSLFNILIAGSVNAAIIPIFSDVLYKKGEGRLVKLFSVTMITVGIISILVTILLFIFAEPIAIFLLKSGFVGTDLDPSILYTDQDIQVLLDLMRIMLVSPMLLGLSSVSMGFLQTHKKFFITTSAPLFYNIAIIIGSLLLTKFYGLNVYGLALSVVIGSLLHIGIQVPVTVRFIRTHLHIRSMDGITGRTVFYAREMLEIARLSIPRILGFAGEHLNAILNTVISFSVSVGALSAYRFALSLHLFPVHIFAGAMSQVMLPNLAEFYAKNQMDSYVKAFQTAFRMTLFVILPATVTLVILRLPIVRLALGVGAFDWWDTVVTSWALALLAGAVVGQAMVTLVLKGLFAIHETRLPLVVTVLTIVVNIVTGYYFTNFFSHYTDWRPIFGQVGSQLTLGATGGGLVGVYETIRSFVSDLGVWFGTRNVYDAAIGGLALSLSISFMFEFILNLYFLNRKVKVLDRDGIYLPALKMIFATVVMSVMMYSLFKLTDFSLDTTRTINVINVFLLTFIPGISIYYFFCKAVGLEETKIISNYVERGSRFISQLLQIQSGQIRSAIQSFIAFMLE